MNYKAERDLNIDGRDYSAGDKLAADHRQSSLSAAETAGWISQVAAPARKKTKPPKKERE